MICQHRTKLLKSCLNLLFTVFYNNQHLIRLHIRADRTCAHVGLVSKDCIAYIIIMRNLNIVTKNYILKLCRVSNHAAISHQSLSADKCAVTNLCIFTNNCRTIDTCGRCNLGRFCNPDVPLQMIIFISIQCFSQLYDEITNFRKYLPWIGFSLEKFSCNSLRHIQHVRNSKIF